VFAKGGGYGKEEEHHTRKKGKEAVELTLRAETQNTQKKEGETSYEGAPEREEKETGRKVTRLGQQLPGSYRTQYATRTQVLRKTIAIKGELKGRRKGNYLSLESRPGD